MPTKKTREEIYYVNTCIDCGKEFEVSKDSTEKRCYSCRTKKNEEQATKRMSYLVDAKITAVTPFMFGHIPSSHIAEITVETTDRRKLVITAGGYYDERYMDLKEEK